MKDHQIHLQKGTKHKCSIIIHKTEATRENEMPQTQLQDEGPDLDLKNKHIRLTRLGKWREPQPLKESR